MEQTARRQGLRRWVPSFLVNLKRALQRPLHLSRSAARIAALGKATNAEEAWEMLQAYRGWGEFAQLRAVQEKSEICSLLDLLRAEGVRTACEIGSFLGGTLFMMTRVLPDDAQVYSLDWPEAPGTLGSFPRTRKQLYERFARPGQKVTVLHGNSQDPRSVARLTEALGGTPLDFLMIDGDHSFEGVQADFRNYSGLVRPGGLIGFHDVVGDEANTEKIFHYRFGVARFWNALKDHYRHQEFIDPDCLRHRNGGGIGVLWWDGCQRPGLA